MLEILALIALGKNIAAEARKKGRSGPAYVFLLLGLWFGGEVGGAVVAVIISMLVTGGGEPNMLMVYIGALVCAVVGAMIAFQIVWAVPPLNARDDYDRYEYPDDDDDGDRDPERGRGRERDRDRY